MIYTSFFSLCYYKRGLSPLFVFFILFSFNFATASTVFSKNLNKAHYHILDLNFDSAQVYIEKENELNPDNLLIIYLENYIDILTVFISGEAENYNKLKENQTSRIELLPSSEQQNSPYYNFILSELYLYWAFIKVKFGDYLPAAYDIYKAKQLVEENEERFPGFLPNNKNSGLLNVLLGSIPSQYSWITDMIGLKGDYLEGINRLQKLLQFSQNSEEYSFTTLEAIFTLTFIYTQSEEYNKDLRELNSLISKNYNNCYLLAFSNAKISSKLGDNDQAIKILTATLEKQDRFPFYYLEYLLGRAKLNKLDTQSVQHFQNYIHNYKGNSYKKSCYQKMAWYYLINYNDTLKYLQYINTILDLPDSDLGADKEADKEALKQIVPDISLLKARLFFDGGYYDHALKVLTFQKQTYYESENNMLELYYRLGRIYHKLKQLELSIKYYKLAMEMGENINNYYAPFAALQLGYIYQQENNIDESVKYFKVCLSYKDYEYKDAFDQKAKAELNKLKHSSN